MRMPARLALAAATLIVVGACSGPAASPSAAPSASPGSSPDAQTYWLRMTTTQAIPPLERFAVQPPLVITGDGIAITYGPVPAIYPGPLMPNLIGRRVSGAGQAAIIQAAGGLGLLSGKTDFTGGGMVIGGVTGHIELTVDGRRVQLSGNPSAQIVCVTTPCHPAAGTPEAFGELWRRLGDLQGWLGAELGPETPYVAASYALLVGPAPRQDPMFTQAPADWPLDQPIALFGGPVANGTARCGTVSGADADKLRPVLQAANQLTQWIQDPQSSASYGLTTRPMVPGEDICGEIFGPG